MLRFLFRTSFLLFFLWLGMSLLPAAASHLVGGELTYKYLDSRGPANTPIRYELTARVYFNGEATSSAPNGSPNIRLSFYSKAPTGIFLQQLTVPMSSSSQISQPSQPGCTIGTPRVVLGIYRTTVSLPAVAEGYLATFTANARNAGITNLVNSQGESMTISVSMAPAGTPNASPAFTLDALTAVCLGDTSYVLNNAYDADGDRLSYSLATPDGTGFSQSVNYALGYNSALPFGTAGYAAIDSRTGLARYFCRTQGTFLLAIDVNEYRTINGREVLLGTLRRDIQVVVRACGTPNQSPAFTAATSPLRSLVVEEGQAVTFNIAASDPDAQPLTMTASSVLLDGPGAIDATFNGQPGATSSGSLAGNASVLGTGAVAGAFRLLAGCGLARSAPYDVLVTVADDACNSKTIAAIFRITVTRQAPPTRVRGDSVLCAERLATYTAMGPAFAQYRWTVRGGLVRGPATGRAVQVEWTTAGSNQVAVRGITPNGCPTDSAVQVVTIEGGPLITGSAVYCRKDNTGLRYAIAGPPAAYQWTLTNGTLVSGQGTNEVVIDIPEGATATLQVAKAAPGACTTSLRISQNNKCLYFYNVITPNGDGQNDVFTIENVERYPNTSLTIFNRWGRRMYHSDDYHNTYGGAEAGPGVFYYLCQLADGTRYKGWFEVVK